jgi:hypothetical protein
LQVRPLKNCLILAVFRRSVFKLKESLVLQGMVMKDSDRQVVMVTDGSSDIDRATTLTVA